jgi:hypothetical protein
MATRIPAPDRTTAVAITPALGPIPAVYLPPNTVRSGWHPLAAAVRRLSRHAKAGA